MTVIPFPRRPTLGEPVVVAGPPLVIRPASDPDAELLAGCARYLAADHALRDAHAGAVSDDEADDLAGERYDALAAISTMKPQTPEGARAKAAIACREMIWRVKVMKAKTWQEQADPFEMLVITTLGDLARRIVA